MLGVKLPFKITSCEDAAYDLSIEFQKRGFNTDVESREGVYCTVIQKQRLIHNVLGTPATVTATFFPLQEGTGVEVREGDFEANIENIIKETAMYVLIIPGIVKRIDAVRMEKAIMRKAVITAKKLRQ